MVVFARTAFEHSLMRRSPAPKFREDAKEGGPQEIISTFKKYLNIFVNSLEKKKFCAPVSLIWGDSTRVLPRKVCGILTSPPFANNIDYVRHTMLELLWSGLARDSRDLGRLRDLQVPACEAAARSWKRGTELQWVLKAVSGVGGGKRARGYRRFLVQYFKAMEGHLRLVAERLERRAWYTVGDSIIGGLYLPVHEILARIASSYGLKAEAMRIGRRYRGGRHLYLLELEQRR